MMPTMTTCSTAEVITRASEQRRRPARKHREKIPQYKTYSSRIYSAGHSLINMIESNISRHVKRLDTDLKCWNIIQD